MKKVRELLQQLQLQSTPLISISWGEILFDSKYRNALVLMLWIINSLIIYGVFSFSYSDQRLGYVYILILIALSPLTYYLFYVIYSKWGNLYGVISLKQSLRLAETLLGHKVNLKDLYYKIIEKGLDKLEEKQKATS